MTFATYDAAITALSSVNATQADLIAFVRQLSVDAPGSTTVLYSGDINRTPAWQIVKGMGDDVRRIDKTMAADVLNSPEFKAKIAQAFGEIPDAVEFDNLPSTHPAKLWLNKGGAGPWAIASEMFVEATTGEVRILTLGPTDDSVLWNNELPKLLDKLQNSADITAIDGISRDDLLKIIAPASLNDVDKEIALRNSILSTAVTQTHFTKPGLGSYGSWLSSTPDSLKGTLQNLSAAEQKAWQDLLNGIGGTNIPRAAVRAFSKLGVIGGVVTFALMSSQASAAELNGDHEGAKQIVTEWGLDTAGSAAGQALGAAAGAAALTALAAVGVVFTAPIAGALVIGAALLGGIFGGDAAQGIYDLTKDQDDNGKLDLFDRLTKLLYGDSYSLTTPLPATLDGGRITLDASFSREEIVAASKTDIAWRYALRELNAFVIPNIDYSGHNTDGSLDLYNPATGQGAMTDLYLADRAAMLTWKIRYDKGYKDDNDGEHLGAKPYYETWDSNAVNGDWDFIDYTLRQTGGAALKLSINGKGDAADHHRIVFGSDTNDAIDGAGEADHLYGMAGNDTLTGKGGNDYLEGGAGFDTYVINAGDGYDTVLDADGSGVIKIGGVEAKGSAGVAADKWIHTAGSDTWVDQQNGITYTKSVMAGETRLLIHKGDANVLVKGWSEGELGIVLGAGAAPDLPATTTIIPGDKKPLDTDPAKSGVQAGYDANHNLLVETTVEARQDILYGAAGNELIRGYSGTDYLDGRDGDDLLEGGTGSDVLAGGQGADVLKGEDGNDILLGDHVLATVDSYNHTKNAGLIADAWLTLDGDTSVVNWNISIGNTASPGAGGADVIEGGLGNDYAFAGGGDDLVDGGGGDDILFGEGGKDVLLGQAGDDRLVGDGYGAGGPYGDDYLEGGDGADVLYGTGGNDQLVGGGGNDILVGGIGVDVMFGDARPGTTLAALYEGDDILYGEAGDDQLAGGGGNDDIYGGADNDTLRGESGIDLLDGGLGNDYLDGGTGADIMAGGADNDTYIVDDVHDAVIEAAGEGIDTINSAVNITLSGNVEWLNLTGVGNIDATGNAEANNITGNAGANDEWRLAA